MKLKTKVKLLRYPKENSNSYYVFRDSKGNKRHYRDPFKMLTEPIIGRIVSFTHHIDIVYVKLENNKVIPWNRKLMEPLNDVGTLLYG